MADEQPPPDAIQNLPFAEQGPGSISDWQSKLEQAKKTVKTIADDFAWTKNVERYVTKGLRSAPSDHTVQLPKDYSYTEQKKPLLFFQLPDVMLSPARPDVTAESAQLFQAVLNHKVSPKEMNCKAAVDECLVDALVPAGIGILKLGYEAFVNPRQKTKPQQVGEQPAVDPMTGQPQLDPMGQPVLEPVIVEVPNIIRERYFGERVSPVDFFWDNSFRGSDWAKCSWMAVRFRMSAAMARTLWGLEDDRAIRHASEGKQPDQYESLAPDRTTQTFGGVEGLEVWYHAVDVDPECGDPDHIRYFVWLDGMPEPIIHQDSPYQDVPDGVVMNGLRRIPIYPFTLRYVSDFPIPPSDCAQSRVIVDELSQGRTQMIQQRDRNLPLRGIDISKYSPDSRQKLVDAGIQEIIPFDGVTAGENPLFGLTNSAFPQENFNFNNYGERDLQECWALSGPNLGVTNTSGRTATELSMAQQGTETRMGSEQTRVEAWWVDFVMGLAALLQKFATETEYVQILGPAGAMQIVGWNNQQIAGEYAFQIRPDSSKRLDQVAERKFRLDTYNLLRNDPLINQEELDRWMMPSLGMNPDKMIKPPQPPQPEPPKISINIGAENLSPLAPEYENVRTVLAERGINLPPRPGSPAALQQGAQPPNGTQPGAPGQGAQPPHPGAPGGVAPLNKRAIDMTGQLPGPTGQSRPM